MCLTTALLLARLGAGTALRSTDGFFGERGRAEGFMLGFPLEVQSRDKIHEGQPCRHALDLLLVAAVAFANDIPIEL